jgi:hypothetical protein
MEANVSPKLLAFSELQGFIIHTTELFTVIAMREALACISGKIWVPIHGEDYGR